jgi:hypothetical protein
MPTTAITVVDAGPHFYSQVGRTATEQAVDVANGNHIPYASCTDDMLLTVRNAGGTPRALTITSIPLRYLARTGDVSLNVPANGTKQFRLKKEGWAHATNGIVMTGAHADLKISVLDLTQQATT